MRDEESGGYAESSGMGETDSMGARRVYNRERGC